MTSGEAQVELAPVRPGEELDWKALESYLREHLPSLEGDFSVMQFPRGSANLTYRVTIGQTPLVIRRPPFGTLAPGAHDMGREYKVLSKLYREYPRAPHAMLHCDDHSVVGAEFFVNEYREGIVVWDRIPQSMTDIGDAGERIGLAVIDALADLHEVDPESVGLSDLGRPEGYLQRQLAGWQRRWAAVEAEAESPDTASLVREVGARLVAQSPSSQRSGIVHNDYKVDNCQFAPGDPNRVTAVFDWDMATLGDTLVDLGTLLNYWPDSTVDPASDSAFTAVPGMTALQLPSRQAVVERYASSTTLDLSDLGWYEAFGCWKTAVILQQLYARYVRGETPDPRMGERGAAVAPLGRRALELLS